MDYEKGAPRNLVQFSEYNDLAFTDTGVTINDTSKPSRNVIWSSDRVERRINEILGGGNPQSDVSLRGPGASVNVNLPGLRGPGGDEYYPNNYRRYFGTRGKIRVFRVLRPSWWLSFIIPSRQHYCDKCCNYLDHTWSTVWNDNPRLANNKCECSSKCSQKLPLPPAPRK